MDIKKVVVIGSGTMGSGIAAHLCNANIPVTLLDLTTEISEKARDQILKSKPPLLIDKSQIKNKDNALVVLAWNFYKDIKKNNLNLSNNIINVKDLETNK